MMCKLLTLAVLVAFSGTSPDLTEPNKPPVNSTCPIWTLYNASTNRCECGENIFGIVTCVPVEGFHNTFVVGVTHGFCMTLNNDQTKPVVGSCPFSVKRYPYQLHIVPNDASQLDIAFCGFTHRTGQLCRQCENGTSPPVYSYYPQCVHCPAGTNNWAKYLAVSLLPTTLFFVGTVVIKLRATSPHMNGYIMFCQILASSSVVRRIQEDILVHPHENNLWVKIYISLLGFWNLDFFRMIYPPFCLHSNATILQVLSLDYTTAAYPLLLILLTYTLVLLHYHNCRLVVCLWRPFLRCCIRFQRQWDIRNSLVDAFATFLLLSYVKFLSVSFDILTPTILWNSTGERQPTTLYYSGTIKYLSNEHLPYAVLAIVVLLVFTLLPILLLCLYPCRCFQQFLNRCQMRSQALHMFMDAFQGCYKNGTNGTRDCRYFAAIYLITQIAVHVSLVFSSGSFTNSVLITALAIVVLILSTFHPYKDRFYNLLDIFFFVCMMPFISSLWYLQGSATLITLYSDRLILQMLVPIPIIYPLCLVLYHTWRKSRRLQRVTEWIRAFLSRPQDRRWADSLPRRVILDEASGLLNQERQH